MRRILICTAAAAWAASNLSARPADKGPWKPVLGDAEYKLLTAAETKVLKDTLDKGIDEKKAALKARNSAMMLAAYAQSMMAGGKDAAAMAGARDAALACAKEIADGKADAAKKLAGAAGKPGDTKLIDLSKGYELGDMMTQFKPEKGGGRELEKKLKTYMQKRAALTPDELKDAVVSAYMTAIIAHYTEAMAPAADSGAKKMADWLKWTADMEESALAAAKAAGAAKPDDKAVKAAFKKLDESCAKCHAVFRD